MIITHNWKDITQESYDLHAADFARHASIYRGKLKEWIYSFVSQLPEGSFILDVGCGAGRDAKFFIDYGFGVVGIDFSKRLLKIAKQHVPSAKFMLIDFEKLIFPKERFDGVWASASLYHIPKKKLSSVLENIYSTLKKNGLFFAVIREGNGEKMTEERRGDAVFKRFAAYYQPKELVTMLTGIGFKEVSYELDSIRTVPWIGVWGRK